MCQGSMHEFLLALPKVEHHLHIEGTLEPSLLFTLASKNNITLPSPASDPAWESESTLIERYKNFTSLDDFLHYYFIGMTTLITSDDFETLAFTYFQRAHSQNVRHAEIFFDPQAHVSRGVSYSTILTGLHAAQTRAEKDFNLTSELIPCLLRHLDPSDCHDFYLTTLFPSLQSREVRGLGLSSTELNRPPTLFKPAFDHAHSNSFNLTAHAGEEADASYMASALEHLHITRCDHGIKLASSPDLMSTFAKRRVLVTMCPISNVTLRAVTSIAVLPIREYIDNEVKFSLNSDDPAYFGGNYIQENYCAVQQAFELSVHEWGRICRDAVEGSWCGEERKRELERELEGVFKGFETS